MIKLLLLLVIVKLVDAATIGLWSYSSSCSGTPSATYTAYTDLCTARLGEAITLSECSSSKLRIINFPDSTIEKVRAPICGTGKGFFTEASTTCTKFSDLGYTKIIDATCKAPSTTFLATPYVSKCSLVYGQSYSTISADGQCNRVEAYSFYYKASVSSSNTLNFRTFDSSLCNESKPDAVWNDIRTTGECTDTLIKDYFESLAVSIPAAYTLPSAASAIGAIVGGIIGTIIWCFGCWGVLHACGCVNCPCFNRCCDRRKNIASSASSSSPSYPSSSPYGAQMASPYGAQAPRASNPYGNVRHV